MKNVTKYEALRSFNMAWDNIKDVRMAMAILGFAPEAVGRIRVAQDALTQVERYLNRSYVTRPHSKRARR